MGSWGSGRVTVSKWKNEITEQLKQGFPLKEIYRHLEKADAINVTYNSFRRQVIIQIGPIKNFSQPLSKPANTPVKPIVKTLYPTPKLDQTERQVEQSSIDKQALSFSSTDEIIRIPPNKTY